MFECGSKHFYQLLLPDHNKKAAAKGPINKREQWLTELGIPEEVYKKACQSDKSLYFDLLPAERSVFKKLTWLGHQDGAKQGWWSLEKTKCKFCPHRPKDNHFHIFWRCDEFALPVWAHLMSKLAPLLNLAKGCGPARAMSNQQEEALCLLGLTTDHKLAPQWWLLMQRITLKLIWNFYTDHKYGHAPGPTCDTHATKIAELAISTARGRVSLAWETAQRRTRNYEDSLTLSEITSDFNTVWAPFAKIPSAQHDRRRRRDWHPSNQL